MSFKFNPFTGKLDYYEQSFLGVFAAAPTEVDNTLYFNSTDSTLYVGYSGTWHSIAGGGVLPETFYITDHLGNPLVDNLGNNIVYS